MDKFRPPTKEQIIAFEQKCFANLKFEWQKRTAQICEEQKIEASVLNPRTDAFIFRIGKMVVLSTMRHRSGTKIKCLSDADGVLKEVEMTTGSPDWKRLFDEVVAALQKHKRELTL